MSNAEESDGLGRHLKCGCTDRLFAYIRLDVVKIPRSVVSSLALSHQKESTLQ